MGTVCLSICLSVCLFVCSFSPSYPRTSELSRPTFVFITQAECNSISGGKVNIKALDFALDRHRKRLPRLIKSYIILGTTLILIKHPTFTLICYVYLLLNYIIKQTFRKPIFLGQIVWFVGLVPDRCLDVLFPVMTDLRWRPLMINVS